MCEIQFFQIAHELQAIPVHKIITASALHERPEGLKINEYV